MSINYLFFILRIKGSILFSFKNYDDIKYLYLYLESLIFICVSRSLFYKFLLYKVYNKGGIYCGQINQFKENDTLTVEVDLRSQEPEKRKAHFFVNNELQDICINNLPEKVQFGVLFFIFLYFYTFLFFIFIFLY